MGVEEKWNWIDMKMKVVMSLCIESQEVGMHYIVAGFVLI